MFNKSKTSFTPFKLLLVFSHIHYHLYLLSESKYSAHLDDKLDLCFFIVATVHLLQAFANKV